MARYVLSVWTTTKIAAGSFLVGVIVGFRLKNIIRKGVEKLLKRLQRD
jgi:small-conductance mechanosensitive channel